MTQQEAMETFLHPKDLQRFYSGSRESAWCRKLYRTICDAYQIDKKRGGFLTLRQFCEYTDIKPELAIRRFGLQKTSR